MHTPINIFISYSHQDQSYLEANSLLGFLNGLEQDHITFWTDQHIKPGELWDEEIKTQLHRCDIALVLISQAFLDSNYCRNVEIANLLATTKYLFPLILSPCDWQRHAWLSSRQFLPGGERTVEEHYQEPGERKRLFLQIRKALFERAELIRQAHSSNEAIAKPASRVGGNAEFSGKTKIEFCRRLGADWHLLADFLDITPAEQNRFPTGYEAGEIWVWLQNRKRLAELPDSLIALNRADLAVLFSTPT